MQRSDTFHFLRMKKFSVFLHGVIQYQWMFERQDIKQKEDNSEKSLLPQNLHPKQMDMMRAKFKGFLFMTKFYN